ncbi:MAG TPA: radical SAM protein [Methanocella sp.]|nr:radical SAM protein [Methanocella sp.]
MKISRILRSRFFTHTPLVLTHNVTYLCNCKCKTCDLWKKTGEYHNDLTQEQALQMLDDARDAGMAAYVAWGGEPLMRKDLPVLLERAKQNGMHTTVITNGYLLESKCEEIAPHVDLFIVSIDADGTLHDEMRGLDGVFDRAVAGIRKCRAAKKKVMINSVISTLNPGKAEGLVRLAKELGVPIAFEPLNVYPGYNEHLRPNNSAIQAEFSTIEACKRSGTPIVNSYQYLDLIRRSYSASRGYVCHAPKVFIEVQPDGTVARCTGGRWCNVKEKKLKELFTGPEYQKFCREVEKCDRCVVSCVIESSFAYSMNPMFLLEKVRTIL